MEYLFIPAVSLLASLLTFFSGFGLGTVLLPVFAIYYPLDVAIALTACVHLLNNLFKLALVFKNINWQLVLKFGIPSAVAALLGAYVLKISSGDNSTAFQYFIGEHHYFVSYNALIIGTLIILFAAFEISPKLSALTFDKKYLGLGGLISGFFGGLSGHQGALRSAFLLRLELEKSVFIASGVMIACMVDVVRISLYTRFEVMRSTDVNYLLMGITVLTAWTGAYFGNKLFKKTSLAFFKWFVALFMLVMGVLIGVGIV
jgi:uncharacterized membrane protein YfcA